MMVLYAILILIGVIALVIGAIALNRYLRNRQRCLSMTFLKIMVPRKESKEDKEKDTEALGTQSDFKIQVGVMKQLFDSLGAIENSRFSRHFRGQDFMSFEYVVQDNLIDFYVIVPYPLVSLIEKTVTSFYPDCFVEEVPDYNLFRKNSKTAFCFLHIAKNYSFPIRTYQRMEADPLNNITNVLSKLKEHESAAIQVMIKPPKPGWQAKGRKVAKNILDDKSNGFFSNINPFIWIGDMLSILFRGDSSPNSSDSPMSKTTPAVEEQVKAIEEKNTQLGYESLIRLVAVSDSQNTAKSILTGMKSSFAQYATTDNNALTVRDRQLGNFIRNFLLRNLKRPWHMWNRKMILSSEELASLFHLPNIRFNKAPTINWQNYKIAPAPSNLPTEGILLGYNIYRGEKKEVRLKNEDRFRHFYVIGQTGTGKSSILQVMIRQDFKNGKGLCVVDPHGQLIDDILPFIPRERADDVIYFNPGDLERPMGLNLLESETPEERDMIALDAMNIMIKLFDEEIFGPRIQDYFRNGCLTLMESSEGGALTDIVRLFTDDDFQREKTKDVQNPIVKSFWEHQMAKTGAREKQEMIPYFASKFGQFVTNGMMRNIIGQTKSAFDFSKAMQEGKILLMNLSKGETGDINSKLLGMIIVQKIQVAALRRQRMAKEDRKDFFLYIDEFQNYVTDSIESILSEARKYRLSLNMAHQYLAQLESEGGRKGAGSVNLKDAVFGNVGSIMCYKIGAQDAEYMAKEMAPVFSDQDLINIDKYKAVMKLSIDTQPSKPFSIIPVNPYIDAGDKEAAGAYKQLSRLKYGKDREFIEREIFRRLGTVF
ncbi:type IV secretory system conjugative DNA transfer family protein [Patescibacteria group bacterium]|nr:type IV secretory system conjugative DNA transfer family protein [Patescibacteria group bacterium]